MLKRGILSRIKCALVPGGARPRRIRGGLFRGLRMDIDLRSDLQAYLGLWEREIAGWTRKLSRQAKTAIDVGCKSGHYALFLLKNTDAKVIGIDSDPDAAMIFKRSIALNAFDGSRVDYKPLAVGLESPLDSLLPLEYPVFIKIDIEGGEAEALRSAAQLMRGDTRWVIETHSEALEKECIDILRRAGMKTKIVYNAWWRSIIPEMRMSNTRWLIASRDL